MEKIKIEQEQKSTIIVTNDYNLHRLIVMF